jgi:hypothetical protein
MTNVISTVPLTRGRISTQVTSKLSSECDGVLLTQQLGFFGLYYLSYLVNLMLCNLVFIASFVSLFLQPRISSGA